MPKTSIYIQQRSALDSETQQRTARQYETVPPAGHNNKIQVKWWRCRGNIDLKCNETYHM